MKYEFSSEFKNEFAILHCDTLEERETLLKLPFIHKNKIKTVLMCRFQYLVDLKKQFPLKSRNKESHQHLIKLFDKVKYLAGLSKSLEHKGYDYEQFIWKGSDLKPHDFQKVGADYIVEAKKCILADDVGLGKTIQSIIAACRLLKEGKIKKSIMIVATAGVKYQWLDEIHEHIDLEMFPEFKNVTVVEGTKKQREFMYQKTSKIYILNYEQFIHDFKSIYFLAPKIDAIILDEASKIKNPSAQRTKKLRTLMNRVPIKMLLTATPIENKLQDLFSLYQFLDPTVFTSYKYFVDNYCIFTQFRLGKHGPMIKKLVGYKNLGNAKLKISGMYLRRTVNMVNAQLPNFVVQLRYVDLLPEQRKLYDKVKDQEYEFKMKQIHLLHQICNDPEQLDSVTLGKSAKINELMTLLEDELTDEKVVIFSFYRRFTDILHKKLKKYNPLYIHGGTSAKDREKYRQMFNKMEKYRVMVMTSAGEFGVDFPSASVLVNMDLPENPSRLKQRCGRIRRLSSKFKNVRIINIMAKDTIEEKTVKNIFRKMKLFTEFFNEDNPDLISGGNFYAGLKGKSLKDFF